MQFDGLRELMEFMRHLNLSQRVCSLYILINLLLTIFTKLMQRQSTTNCRNMKSPSSSRQHPLKTYICLNPKCSTFPRCFSLSHSQKQNATMPHKECSQWCWDINQLDQLSSKQTSEKASGDTFDFLLHPIKSIFMLSHFSRNQWEGQIWSIFQMIQKELNDYVEKMLNSKFEQISECFSKVSSVCETIKELAQGQGGSSNWTLRHERLYEQKLHKQLKAIQGMGRLNVFNCEVVSNQIDVVKKQMDKVTWGIWESQSEFSISERMNQLNCREEINSLNSNLTKQELHNRIQKVSRALKLKQFTIEEQENTMLIKCEKCEVKVESRLANRQDKKTQCFSLLLQHFSDKHESQILNQFMKKINRVSHRLTYQAFLKEISVERHRQFLIIDRENINTEAAVTNVDEDVYTLEVVSKPRENLATGRYLVAESEGKDAADILIILVLYEISRMMGKSRITLLTNDHFGKTMQPIFAAIGMRISLANKYVRAIKIVSKEDQMIIQLE